MNCVEREKEKKIYQNFKTNAVSWKRRWVPTKAMKERKKKRPKVRILFDLKWMQEKGRNNSLKR